MQKKYSFKRSFLDFYRWQLLYKSEGKEGRLLKNPINVNRADPFILFIKGEYHIIFEEFGVISRKGKIRAGVIDTIKFRIKNVKTILKDKHHLSFPFVFYYSGEWYLIPESSESQEVNLYRLDFFPYKIVFVRKILSNHKYVDSNLIQINGTFYLFTTSLQVGSDNDNLYIYYSDDLLFGEFKSHPKNPVVEGKEKSRNAGSLQIYKDNLYRYSQNCSVTYGEGIVVNRVIILTKFNYKEIVIDKFKSNNFFGVHTYNRIGHMEIYDLKTKSNKMYSLFFNFLRIIYKLTRGKNV